MATVQQIMTALEGRLTAAWGNVLAAQALYRLRRGRFFQGLPTVSTTPDGEADVSPDRLADRPHDQPESWADEADIPVVPRVRQWIDVYQSPAGHGFVLWLAFRTRGQVYLRSRQHGPEPAREVGWHAVGGGE